VEDLSKQSTWAIRAFLPIGVEYGVDREVHATAGQEADATCSFSYRPPGVKQEIHSIPTGKML
jgi:hypothetical protein